MPSSGQTKAVLPHLVSGIFLSLPAFADLDAYVAEQFSPLKNQGGKTKRNQEADSFAESVSDSPATELDLNSCIAFIASSCMQTVLDSGLKSLPADAAIFLSLPQVLLSEPGVSAGLSLFFQQSYEIDPTLVLYDRSRQSIVDALSWLDRAECSMALLLALDLENSGGSPPSIISILLASADSAKIHKLAGYASLQNQTLAFDTVSSKATADEVLVADWQIDPRSIGLYEYSCLEKNPQRLSGFLQLRAAAADLKESFAESSIWTEHDRVCFLSALSLQVSDQSELLSPLLAILSLSLALDLRVIPAANKDSDEFFPGPPELISNKHARPWIHPVSPVEDRHPRRGLIDMGGAFGLVLAELGNDLVEIRPRKLKTQSSELFIFSGESIETLQLDLAEFRSFLKQNFGLSIFKLAYFNNCLKAKELKKHKLAIIAQTAEELEAFLEAAEHHLSTSPEAALHNLALRPHGISYSPVALSKLEGKLAFVLPGLGASYPHMLEDLCFYFPELRQVFDYVERLALAAGDKIIPSRAIFPVENSRLQTSQAALATMDSAVVALLLAEWAIFALLKELGISPDLLIGCSTGEFAAITMSEAVDILEASQTFYKLSTEVSRSISIESLSKLRSIRIAASYEKVLADLLEGLKETVYLSADLSETCVLVSGEKGAIDELLKILKQKEIDYLSLPVAIPYHTPLVAGKVSASDREVKDLKMGSCRVESWSCSTAGKYPNQSDELRKISTELFEKPILLRKTILAAYDEGARVFVEVGPKGGLIPFISETLEDLEHLAVAANLPGRSGIDQFNSMLAALACHGVNMKLDALYQRRLGFEKELEAGARELFEDELMDISQAYAQAELMSENDPLQFQFIDPLDFNSGLSDEVMICYLASLQDFHASLMSTQEKLMMAYLQGEDTPEIESEDSLATGYDFQLRLPQHYPFLPDPALYSYEDCFGLQFSLSTGNYPFLLDHAIGGQVRSSKDSSRIHLLPLMVALEIMAEGASLLCPALLLSKLSDIRAYKRIAVTSAELLLNLEMKVLENNCVETRICLQDGDPDDSTLLASCIVEFASVLPAKPERSIFASETESRKASISAGKLYCKGSMFHGPLMQSVESIELVARKQIEGKLRCRPADNWFASSEPERMLPLIIDPLMLDNGSQFVLYQMYEHEIPAIALLPFHIESIEFFQGYHEQCGKLLTAAAHLRSMSLRGTEARVEISDEKNQVLARINDVSSRAIVLSEKFQNFVQDPSVLLCRPLEFDESGKRVIASILRSELPEDETTLDWLGDYLLTQAEQSQWRKVARSEKRRLDWLSGRIAAKDAARILLRGLYNIILRPADIEIRSTDGGGVELFLPEIELSGLPQISISHCSNMTVALAEEHCSERHAGIDVEDAVEREEGFAELAFTKTELGWLAKKSSSEKSKFIAALWTAKEAAAKACGSGLAGNPRLFELLNENSKENLFEIRASAGERPGVYSCRVLTDLFEHLSIAFVENYRRAD